MIAVHQPRPLRRPLSAPFCTVFVLLTLVTPQVCPAQVGTAPQGYDDHKNMMEQLGIKTLRQGPNPNDQSTFDEMKANPYKDSMPDVLRMKDGTKVTRARQWPKRRTEILEDFEREVYGRIPKDVPKVTWEVTATTPGESGGIPTVTKTLVGHVDNSAYPQLTVDIQASFTVPAHTKKPVPVMIEFSFGFGRPGFMPAWQALAISKGWGYGKIVPTSIQPDNNRLRTGIIGLTNKGQPRKPDDWGALRAWAWGVSRLIDYFEQNRDSMVDPKKVGIEGLSRYGKAAIVAQAFDPRVAVGLIGSSGEGGVKLHRHIFGEAIENLAGGEYYWMAGNIIKYGSADPPMTAADLPVDSHELIALCAPRPCFISYGVVERGDAKWVDAHGSFMAAVLAGPVYRLLGKKDLGTSGDYLTDPMPPVGQLVGGELAWRQHEGGHDVTPNWPAFFEWVQLYIKAPEIPKPKAGAKALTETPTPRQDPNSLLAHRQLVEKAKKGGIDLYFLGDSIVRRWGTSDPQYADLLKNWNENFFGWNAGNFGWGADRIENILWRLENGELDGVNPKVIVILAGTNNVGLQPDDATVDGVTKGIQALLRLCKTKAPRATIILTALFPRNDNMAATPVINRINAKLAGLADGKTVRFLNVNDRLADRDERLVEGVMNGDKLHPTVRGYQMWADGLKPMLTELLGPPASTDHAPPPTGDPSVSRRN
jgi:lysophospholipase L1-like esterase